MPSRLPSHIATTVGANIRMARRAAGLTQRELARQVNDVEPLAVSRWERGYARPTDANLLALAAALSRDPAWFFVEHEVAA